MFGDDTSLAVITGAKKVLTDRPRELPRARGAVGLNAFPPSTYEPKFEQKSKKIEVISSRQKWWDDFSFPRFCFHRYIQTKNYIK